MGQGYIFTGVRHSVNRGGSASVHAGIHLPARETPLQGRPPARETPLLQGDPPAKETPHCQGDPLSKETPLPRRPPPRRPLKGDPSPRRPPASKETPPPGPNPGGKLRGTRSRPTAKGEIEGDQIHAHTQGGNLGGSDPGPHPRGKFRGIRSRPTPKGEIQGDEDQTPPTTTTAAGGTHPTGMHSC